MAFRYLKEGSTTDGYQLEDASGIILMEDGQIRPPTGMAIHGPSGARMVQGPGTPGMIQRPSSNPATTIANLSPVASMADANEFAVNEAGTTKKATLTQMEAQMMATPTITSPIIAAHTASANTAMKFTSGTVLTTPEAGAIEYDGSAFYMDPVASNRGSVHCQHFACLSGTYTLTNTGNAQALFNVPANGTLTLPDGLFFFECLFRVTSMDSGSSSNLAFGIKGGGGSTAGSYLYHTIGADSATAGTVGNRTGSTSVADPSIASIVTGSANANLNVLIKGTFRVTGAGTIIPSVTLAVGAAAVVAIGSYFRCYSVGPSSTTTIGNWA